MWIFVKGNLNILCLIIFIYKQKNPQQLWQYLYWYRSVATLKWKNNLSCFIFWIYSSIFKFVDSFVYVIDIFFDDWKRGINFSIWRICWYGNSKNLCPVSVYLNLFLRCPCQRWGWDLACGWIYNRIEVNLGITLHFVMKVK